MKEARLWLRNAFFACALFFFDCKALYASEEVSDNSSESSVESLEEQHIEQLPQIFFEAFSRQFLAQHRNKTQLRKQLFEFGYDGPMKKEICDAIDASTGRMERISHGLQHSVDSEEDDNDLSTVIPLSIVVPMFTEMQQMPRHFTRILNVAREYCAASILAIRSYRAQTVYAVVMRAKLYLQLLRVELDLYEQTPEKMCRLAQWLRKKAESRGDVPDADELLRKAQKLTEADQREFYAYKLEVYSRGFIKWLRILCDSAAYDIRRKDDSGETLLSWAERVDLPLVAEELKGLGAA